MNHNLMPLASVGMKISTTPVAPITAPATLRTDARSLSDHENRLHFFDRFAKGAPKLASSRAVAAGVN